MYYYILSKNDIIKFTYEDYLKVLKQREKQKHNILNEELESYEIINEKDINNKHDKTYRKLLDNKKDVAYIINEALNLKEIKVKPEELVEILKTIIMQLKDEEDKRNLVGIMTVILKGKLGEETVNKLVKQVKIC